jgi:endonuclease-3
MALSSRKTESVSRLFEHLSVHYPHAKTELDYTNPYTLLVAVTLSAQATDISVNKATKALFAIADSPEKMLLLGEAGLKDRIKTIGLYNAKAKNIILMAQQLIDRHDSVVPQSRDALVQLAGVGRKTANVVLNEAFGQPTIAVDTHLFRLAHRLKLSKGKTPDAVETDLEKIIPDRFKQKAHIWMILHGRYVCKARKPECLTCCIADLCPSRGKV